MSFDVTVHHDVLSETPNRSSGVPGPFLRFDFPSFHPQVSLPKTTCLQGKMRRLKRKLDSENVKSETPSSDPESLNEDEPILRMPSSATKKRRLENTPESTCVSSRQSSLEFSELGDPQTIPAQNSYPNARKSTDPIQGSSRIWNLRLRRPRLEYLESDADDVPWSEEEDMADGYDLNGKEDVDKGMVVGKEQRPHQELNSALSKLKTSIMCLEKAHFEMLWAEQLFILKSNLTTYLEDGLIPIQKELQTSIVDKIGILLTHDTDRRNAMSSLPILRRGCQAGHYPYL